MTRVSRRISPQFSSNLVPASVELTLRELQIDVEKIRGEEAWSTCPGPHLARVGKQDAHASWSINLGSGEHHCFSCGWGGPFVLLVKTLMDVKDDEASLWIRKHAGIEVARQKLTGEGRIERAQAEKLTEADLALFIDPPGWARRDKDVILEACREYGVLWDPDKGSWILPVRDPHTNKLRGWQEKNKRFFNNFPEHLEKADTLFGFQLLTQDTAYLYESPLDCVRVKTYGLDGAVSSYGVHVSEAQISLLSDRVTTLYLCLDNDGSGRTEEARIWREHRSRFRRLMFVDYNHTLLKDHGEMPIEDVELSIANAVSAVRYRP